jgi:microsomal dipeptidase-like Zn-dependent dipeptidase
MRAGVGFRRRDDPGELGEVAGLPRLAAVGFGDAEIRAIAWDNWQRVLDRPRWGG